MKTIHLSLYVPLAALLIGITGCAEFGSNPKPPSALESHLFNTVTNYASVTNWVQEGSNLVPLISLQPYYINTPKPAILDSAQGVGTVINTFAPGIGGLFYTGFASLIGLFAYLRSNKKYTDTAGTLAQNIQMILSFVGQLPNGGQYVSTLKDFMEKHQNDAGVIENVLKILSTEVSNTDAKVAANAAIETINSLKSVSTPVPPITNA